MPLYGQTFTLDNPATGNGLNAKASMKGKSGQFTQQEGFLAHYEICKLIKEDGWTVVKDPEGRMGPYATKGDQWVSYDDSDMIKYKVRHLFLA